MAMHNIIQSVIDLLTLGGPIVGLLLCLSLYLFTVFFIKLWQFKSSGLFSTKIRTKNQIALETWYQEASAIQHLGKDPIGSLICLTAESLQTPGLDIKTIHDELSRAANQSLVKLRRYLNSIDLIANLAPLIGLLGTIIGMIEAFQAMESAGKQIDPSLLSGGIWKALLTTAIGLIVAIPATFIFSALDNKIDQISHQMNDIIIKMTTQSSQAREKI